MAVVKFDDTAVGQSVFIPGVGRNGEIIRLKDHGGKRYQVRVLLEDGREITYRRQTWYATSRSGGAVGGVGIDVGAGVAQPEPRRPVGNNVRRSRGKNFKPGARRPPRKPRVPPRKPVRGRPRKPETVESLRGKFPDIQPKVPGPPVPKPAAGVWTAEMKKWFGTDPKPMD